MENWPVAQGTQVLRVVTICDDTGTPIAYTGDETLAGSLWAGADQAALLTLAPTWTTPGSGVCALQISGGATAALAVGTYRLRITVNGDDAFEASLGVGYARGRPRSRRTYCTYADMLRVAKWIANYQALDTDEAGFLDERVQAPRRSTTRSSRRTTARRRGSSARTRSRASTGPAAAARASRCFLSVHARPVEFGLPDGSRLPDARRRFPRRRSA